MKTHSRSFVRITIISLVLIWSVAHTVFAVAWVTNGSLNTARYNHSVTVLPDGKVLVVGGLQLTNGLNSVLSSAELFDPATGIWTMNTNLLRTPRCDHTATYLPNGKVIVSGGSDGTNVLASSELYDPVTGVWTETDSLHTPRYWPSATLLNDGRVLLTGGFAYTDFDYHATSSAELYDPADGTWTTTGSMTNARVYHTATLLSDGRVFVVGGYGGTSTSPELYDPTSGTWTIISPPHIARELHTATLLPNGMVLVAGGSGANGYLNSAEIYDPATDSWKVTGSLTNVGYVISANLLPNGKVLVVVRPNDPSSNSVAEIYDPLTEAWAETLPLNTRRSSPATLLPNGNVFVAGGSSGYFFTNDSYTYIPLSSTEVYDSANGMWTNTSAMNTARWYHTATLLPNGKVLTVGGVKDATHLASAELYDPTSISWATTGSLTNARAFQTATLLPNGYVLVAGGSNNDPLSAAELYNPATGVWTVTGSMITARYVHTATLMSNGKVLVAGGVGGFSAIPSAELYDSASGRWTATAQLTDARWAHTATLLLNGQILVVGGLTMSGVLASTELYDPATGTWTMTGALTTARTGHTATLLPTGKVLVAGGYDINSSTTTSAELYDPTTRTWSVTSSLSTGRIFHTANLLTNGKVLVVGGNGNAGYISSAELYDPSTALWTATIGLTNERSYHTATILPTGKVLVAGGFNGGIAPTNAEFFDIGLGFSNSCQPQITTTTSPLSLGGNLTITGSKFRGVSGASSGSTQDSATDYPLVQLRSIESGQTTFLLTTNWSTNSFTSLPVWNFPPGWAMVTVFVNGIPSTSSIVNITVPVPTPPTITDARMLTNGFQLAFTNSVGAVFGALASTNVSLPLSNWTALGGITEISPGQFQFTDSQATNSPQRFYRVRAN